ncbi:hypothetical protein Tco_0461938 [Tanacetum coccineum]
MKEEKSVQGKKVKEETRDAEIAKQFTKKRNFDIGKGTEKELPFFVAEVKKNMCMYLKNQGGYKQSHFKGMNYEDIRPIFEREQKWIKDFVPIDSKVVGSNAEKGVGSRKKTLSRKRTCGKNSEESVKKRKLEDDTERAELKAYLDIVPGDEIAMEVES